MEGAGETQPIKIMKSLILIPAYGRDYKSQSALYEDIKANKDFRIVDYFNGLDGRYINKPQFKQLANAGFTHLEIRYAKKTRCIFIEISKYI
jgi:hypothetical protein